ncbi:MAG: DNA repair protein RecN [Dysgonamonadaceae bacterium]|jgi:DNA repair protein RecN (Recombination protein N)|nr:DNA repair protein RecN [Dysgonamonadaceae bacterium]
MLQSLTIRNYALISNLEIDFSSGFSVITGETGAGKSIILGALSLILGARSDAKYIRSGTDKCLIEGVFDISSYNLEQFFNEKGLEYDPKTCILRREIWISGKSRAFVNDSPAALNDLRELGAFLIDIHSQHQNLLLADNHFQLQVLDVLAQNRDLKNRYSEVYKNYILLNKQVAELKEDMVKQQAEEDYIRFQFNQIDEAKLKTDEETALEGERKILLNVEEIKSVLFHVGQILSSEENSVLSALKEALSAMQNLRRIYPAAEEAAGRIESAYLDLKDLAPDIDARQERIEFQPEHLKDINARLDLIYSLEQKHHLDSVEDLLALRKSLAEQISTIDHSEETLERLEKASAEAFNETANLAAMLTESRHKTAISFEKQLVDKVSVLGMPSMRFSVNFTAKTNPDITGFDDVTFLFSANRNSELRPVASTASGGEISRLMLGIKALIAGATSLPAIIFDEIDTGVSGETADKMARILRNMGQKMQVIAISHLPQIAAKGESQYLVYKEENNTSTETRIRRLTDDERITEIARILSGANLTEAAVENAKALMNSGKNMDKDLSCL